MFALRVTVIHNVITEAKRAEEKQTVIKMAKLTSNQAAKEIRAIAKKSGLTFKRESATINGTQSYKFIDRVSGVAKMGSCTFWSAYENCMSGYIESYKHEKGCFDGIGTY